MLGTIVLTGLAVAALASMKKSSVSGVGAVKRAKRRIYKEVARAQELGVEFDRKFSDYNKNGIELLRRVGEEFGWKQSKRSIESGKSYEEAYYNSLRRAWNAVSGVCGVGATAWNVRDAGGNIVLTWYEQEQVLDHVSKEEGRDAEYARARVEQMEEELRKSRRKVSQFDHSLMVPNLQEDEPANENYAELPGDEIPSVGSQFFRFETPEVQERVYAELYNNKDIALHVNGCIECIMYDPDLLIIKPYLIGETMYGTVYRGLCGDDGVFNLFAVDPSEKKLVNAIKKVLNVAANASADFDAKEWKKVSRLMYSAPFNRFGKIELQPDMQPTIQQEILKVWPYLKTEDVPGANGKPVVSDQFNWVFWVRQRDDWGKVLYEGPKFASIKEPLEKVYDKKEGKMVEKRPSGWIPVDKVNVKRWKKEFGIQGLMEMPDWM